jgi:type I restriction enzyme M protein
VSRRISQQQLESYLWGAATLLRGTIDAGDYKQFIFPLLFYKRLCDVFDEETQAALKESGGDKGFAAYPENHRFQIPSEAHWLNVRQAAKNVGKVLQSGMRTIETANPDKLYGIFGDAQWTNKDRLSDAMLRDLVEHFSTLELAVANLPEDELGQGYEYLIKKFADDAGHTAAEFYTNRTVVHLMTEMLKPQPSESIYDPTCGSGGMLLSCITHLRRLGQEWRNVRLYGQERNLMTSSIARMNCFLHGIEDFQIVRGDTLSEPKFVQRDRLMRFDVVLANPPYSIKQWDRDAFASDPWGRNLFGTPPQGRADYAFWQHILCSLSPKTGRCAILFPHGVLFRQEEAEMRRKLIETDTVECVLGLGPNLFYNSPMEACVVICRADKPKARKGRILLINAVNEVTRERAQSFLTNEHIEHIVKVYEKFKDEPGFAHVATLEEIRTKEGSLSIPLYVEPSAVNGLHDLKQNGSLEATLSDWLKSRHEVTEALTRVLPKLATPIIEPRVRGKSTFELLKGKAEWPRVRFGDVVENVNETEGNPAEAGLERFIGLEHLEPGSLHIGTWGNLMEGTTFTRRCRPGQILFGKRRAYQRKVAVAEFDAVVSGDIYVLSPKNDQLMSELLPFLCRSERFFQHAVGTSAGSLSPRTNWSSLASFEFDLPPLDQQRRIAKVLAATNEALCAARRAQTDVATLKNRLVDDAFTKLRYEAQQFTRTRENGRTVAMATVEQLLADGKSLTYGILQPGADDPSGVPMLRAIDIDNGKLSGTKILRVRRDIESDYQRTRLRGGEVLLSVMGTVGRTIVVRKEWAGWNVNRALAVIRLDPRILPEFFYQWLRSPQMQTQLTKDSIGTAQLRINLSSFRSYSLPLPATNRQAEVVASIQTIESAESLVSDYVAKLTHVARSLVNTLLGQEI